MKDRIETDMAHQGLHGALVTHVDLKKSRALWDRVPVSGRKIIHNRDGMPPAQQFSATN